MLAQLIPLPNAVRASYADDLERELRRRSGELVSAASAATAQRSRIRALFAQCRRSERATWYPPGPGPHDVGGSTTIEQLTPQQIASYAVSLQDIAIRDACWIATDDGRLSGPFWLDLARQLPAPFDAAPMFLSAWASWREGNGLLARAAVDRVLQSDPDYRAAHLLASALDGGLDPRRTPRLKAPARGSRKRPLQRDAQASWSGSSDDW